MATQVPAEDRLYFEDLHPGQRFSSGAHEIDEAQIVAFARQLLVDIWKWKTGRTTPQALGWKMS